MKKYYPFFFAAFLMTAFLPLFSQEVTESIIQFDVVKTINFTDKAEFEKTHPLPLIERFIEQGEDHEEDYEFEPKEVSRDAYHYDVVLPDQSQRAVTNSPAPNITFNGTLDNGTLIPPDIRGAAGINHIMETTNQEFKIYSKVGTLISTLSISSFFSGTGGSGYFDPHVLFDPNYSRWVVCIAGTHSNGNGGVFIGISQTDDPTGSWYVYSFDGIGNANDFLDYPLMGYNTNWLVITANDFLSSGGVTGKIYVMNRATLYSGSGSTINVYTDANVFSLAPAQTYDVSQTTLYMVEDWNGNSGGNGYVRIGRITGTASSPSYNSGSTLGVNQPWSESTLDAPQSGSGQRIDAGDTRVGNAVYINGSLWFCQTAFLPASGPTRTAVQWWQVNPATPSVIQFGRVDGGSSSGIFYFYPGIAVNANGDVLLGHCQSSSSSYASASYSTRLASDAVNTIQTPYLYKSGVANYYKTYGGSRNRWGDYTGACIDPINASFWNFNEWANTSNRWGTVIANVSLTAPQPCDVTTNLTASGISDNTTTLSWDPVTGAVSYNLQYRVSGTSSWSSLNTASTSTTLNSLTAGTSYEWQVQTVCTSTTSGFSGSSTFTTTGSLPCATPTSLTSMSISTTSALLGWSTSSGVLSYNVQYRATGSGSWTSNSTTTNSYTASSLSPSTNYEWQVQAVCSSSTSAFSTLANFTTLTPPTTCTDNFESNNSSGSATSLTNNTDVTGLITPKNDVDWFRITTLSPNTYLKVDLTNLPADYDMVLYASNARSKLVTAASGGTASEQIKYNTNKASTYYLKVYGYKGANNASSCYTLRASVSSSSWAPAVAASETNNEKGIQLEVDQTMKIYPNPAKDKVTVEYVSDVDGPIKIAVYNLSGQVVFTTSTTSTPGLNVETINTNTLSPGVYVFELQQNGETQHKQFTIGE